MTFDFPLPTSRSSPAKSVRAPHGSSLLQLPGQAMNHCNDKSQGWPKIWCTQTMDGPQSSLCCPWQRFTGKLKPKTWSQYVSTQKWTEPLLLGILYTMSRWTTSLKVHTMIYNDALKKWTLIHVSDHYNGLKPPILIASCADWCPVLEQPWKNTRQPSRIDGHLILVLRACSP